MDTIQIEPQLIQYSMSKLEIIYVQVVLHISATFTVALKTTDDSYAIQKTVHMPADIYAQWNNDDIFAENYILQELGLTRNPSAISNPNYVVIESYLNDSSNKDSSSKAF